MKMLYAFFAVSALIAVANAKCIHTFEFADTGTSLQYVLDKAKPGTDITLAESVFNAKSGSFILKNSGDEDCPITITGSDRIYSRGSTLSGLQLAETANNVVISMVNFSGEVDVMSKNVVFKKVIFSNIGNTGGSAGLLLKSAGQVTVSQCSFKGGVVDNRRGISIQDSHSVLIDTCGFDSVRGRNVYLERSTQVKVLGCSFTDKSYDPFNLPPWIEIVSGTDNEFTKNNFDPYDTNIKRGVAVYRGNSTFKENVMRLVGWYSTGFYFSDETQKVCASNKVTGGSVTNAVIDKSC